MERESSKSASVSELARIGAAIRSIRTEQAISQENLAHLAGIDRSHMGKIERGERNVTILNIVRIATALSCAPSELLKRADL
jgi:transcriptional regulator with XRE-family HTH domain